MPNVINNPSLIFYELLCYQVIFTNIGDQNKTPISLASSAIPPSASLSLVELQDLVRTNNACLGDNVKSWVCITTGKILRDNGDLNWILPFNYLGGGVGAALPSK